MSEESSTQHWLVPYIVARWSGDLNKILRAFASLHIDTLRHGTATSGGRRFSALYTQPSQLRNYGTLET